MNGLLKRVNEGNSNLTEDDITDLLENTTDILRTVVLHKLNELSGLQQLETRIGALDDNKYGDIIAILLSVNPEFATSLINRDILSFDPTNSLNILNSASSSKLGNNLIDDRSIFYLNSQFNSNDAQISFLSTLTLIKHNKHFNNKQSMHSHYDRISRLASTFDRLPDNVISIFLEALSYLSSTPLIADTLSRDVRLINLMLSTLHLPPTKQSTQLYSQEQAPRDTSIEFTLSTVDPEDEEYMSIEKVRGRNSRMLQAGVASTLSALSRSKSLLSRRNTSTVYLALITNDANRPNLLKDGVVKALLNIISQQPSPLTGDDLHANQALAKMTITTPPSTLYAPPITTAAIGFIRPLYEMLIHPDALQLQQFEALMALTNVSSVGPDLAERVATAFDGGVLSTAEECLLSSHELLQRASTELICNLVGMSESAFSKYTTSARSKVNCGILLALSDAELVETRLGASGALAQLCGMSPIVCAHILSDPAKFLRVIMALLEDSHLGLVHRALVILDATLEACKDILVSDDQAKTAIQSSGLVDTLKNLILRLANEPSGRDVLPILKDTLIKLKNCGISIQVSS
ncbi:hypothetical protein E3Q08_00886 [Wallemia mellicola]|uniref:UNC-45/Cro1/She4 central domain-containing protein n=1 Tax=Wallemia mellicola TaxID=1708541 RepID=A0AB38MPP0_9BASI|nr:hypothetical protein E3Q21_00491 [Wallemia mellicola]TIB92372.1 hypothetical protein E3Q20_00192 [Wallemia mellicola]TIC07885.1 hypothetical protein E3Q16_00245 [Wallemia mellicola]TIC26202.1 hypothetical protein E3Q12_00513 [Wallemia mellicola]TIC37306.1 hypothetical protein E3Q09_00802 [Wallemia mellicola]